MSLGRVLKWIGLSQGEINISDSNNTKPHLLTGLIFPILGALVIYFLALLILQEQKNNAEASLDYLSSENFKLAESLGDIVNIVEYRKDYIKAEMILTDEMNHRNDFLSLLNSTVVNIPNASVIRVLDVKNNYVDIELEMINADTLIEYCQSLRTLKIYCSKKTKLDSEQLSVIAYSIRLKRE